MLNPIVQDRSSTKSEWTRCLTCCVLLLRQIGIGCGPIFELHHSPVQPLNTVSVALRVSLPVRMFLKPEELLKVNYQGAEDPDTPLIGTLDLEPRRADSQGMNDIDVEA